MQAKIYLSVMAAATSMLLLGASGCASSSSSLPSSSSSVEQPAQPPMTDYMRSKVGTPEELSPIAPAEARNVRKVGNQWLYDLNGQVWVYDAGAARWEPQK
jgi:ABC-type phosphate/phosphonate transport system substrate-binding protein